MYFPCYRPITNDKICVNLMCIYYIAQLCFLASGLMSSFSPGRSFGVLFYELDTAGSVPYASFNNSDVRTKASAVVSVI